MLIYRVKIGEVIDAYKDVYPESGFRPVHMSMEDIINMVKGIPPNIDLEKPPVSVRELIKRRAEWVAHGPFSGPITNLEDISPATKKRIAKK